MNLELNGLTMFGSAWHAGTGVSRLCSSRARTGSCAAKLVAARRGVSLTQDLDVAGFSIDGTITLAGALDAIDLASGAQAVLRLSGPDGSQSLRLAWSSRDRHDRARYVLRTADLSLVTAPTSARLTVKLPAGVVPMTTHLPGRCGDHVVKGLARLSCWRRHGLWAKCVDICLLRRWRRGYSPMTGGILPQNR